MPNWGLYEHCYVFIKQGYRRTLRRKQTLIIETMKVLDRGLGRMLLHDMNDNTCRMSPTDNRVAWADLDRPFLVFHGSIATLVDLKRGIGKKCRKQICI